MTRRVRAGGSPQRPPRPSPSGLGPFYPQAGAPLAASPSRPSPRGRWDGHQLHAVPARRQALRELQAREHVPECEPREDHDVHRSLPGGGGDDCVIRPSHLPAYLPAQPRAGEIGANACCSEA